ncbi:Adenosylcobalamin/alpha-ribazole phosphatase [Nymphon striatum]|nr:Adenosylcobalamin/alpha-ribazole phosphatase [Nymphon striatum]
MYRGGGTDHPLSETGWKQMKSRVEQSCLDIHYFPTEQTPWSSVVTSPLSRCCDFASQFAETHQLPLEINENLREARYGAWEGKTPTEVREESLEAYWQFYDDPIGSRPEGAEPLSDFSKRIAETLTSILEKYEGKHILLVSHLGVTRAMLAHVLGIPLVSEQQIGMPYAGMVRLIEDRKGLRRSSETSYRELQFNLSELKSLKVAVSHFSAISELAHVFLLFELENGESFGLSVEARREKGEEYTLHGGLLAQFELVYLIASERDLVGLRKERNEKIYIYPIKIKEKNIQRLFEVVAGKTNKINDKAEFYHLFLKNCTTQIVDLVDKISDKKFPKFAQSFAPGNAGYALYEMGLIDIKATSFEALQKIALLK